MCDHIGTPTQGYNEEGSLIWERELDSYGKPRILQGDEGFCNYLYQGQTLDVDTGLAYNRFRYYDPEEGVYISQDPIGLAGSFMNLYAYVEDTNSIIDPYGLVSILFQTGTYGSLQPAGQGLQAHELMRHKYLQEKGLANNGRLSGNPSIALDMAHHRNKPIQLADGSMTKGGAHYHEAQIRKSQGLEPNQFHSSHKREMDITQGALRKAGIPSSVARRLRKESDKFYKELQRKKQQSYGK